MCGSLEIDSAIDVVQGLSKSMDMYRREASDGRLLLLPGETVSTGLYSMPNVSMCVQSSQSHLWVVLLLYERIMVCIVA